MPVYDRQTVNPFVSNMPVPGPSIEALAQNARTSDLVSRRGRTSWTDYISRRGEFYEDYGDNPTLLGKASFQFASGMTTLSVQVFAAVAPSVGSWSGTHTARVYLDGVERGSMTLSQNAYTNTNISITGLGLVVDQIVEVEVRVTWTVTIGLYRWHDAYVSPVGGSLGAWPSAPTFGAISLANLEQLRTADAWLWSKLARADRPAFTTMFWQRGRERAGSVVLWSGSVARSGGDNLLVVSVDYWILTNQQERIDVVADPNGTGSFSVIASSPVYAAGDTGTWTTFIDISSWPDDTPRYVFIQPMTITPGADDLPSRFGSLYNVAAVFSVWPTLTMNASPAVTSAAESMTFSTLQSRLNAISTSLNATYNRIANNSDVWNRQRCFRQPPILDAGERDYYKQETVARGFRYAEHLWVRGKNVTIAWGGFLQPWANAAGTHPTFVNSKQVISGDTLATTRVSLATLDGLYTGMQYYVLADELIYVGEELEA